MALAVEVSVVVALAVAAATYALGDGRGHAWWRIGILTAPLVLVFAILVGAGPATDATPPHAACRVLQPAVTVPRSCRPTGVFGSPPQLLPSAVRFGTTLQLPLEPGRVTGLVESSIASNDRVTITGWAASPRDHRRARAVLAFSRGRFIGAVRPTIRRLDVAFVERDRGLTLSGFVLELPRSSLQGSALELLAVDERAASRLPFNCRSGTRQLGC